MDETEAATPTAPGPTPAAEIVPVIETPVDVPVPMPHRPAEAVELDSQPEPPGDPAGSHLQENFPMATNYDFNKDATNTMNSAAKGAADQVRAHSDDAMRQGQAAFSQATDKSREVMDKGMKALDEFNTHARGQTDAMMTASKAATQGLEAMMSQATELGRKSFEQATNALRTIAAARTPQDVFAAQNEYMKHAFDNLVHGYSRMTETMMKVTSEVVQPLQNSMTEAAQKAGDTVKNMTNGLTK